MSKKNPDAVAEQGAGVEHVEQAGWKLPPALWIAYAIVLLAGITIWARRDSTTEAAMYAALTDCNASVRPKRDHDLEESGLSEAYGVIQFTGHTGTIGEYLSLCDLQPELAAKIYRRAIKDGNTSAKIVALYSALFLANRKQLTDDDLRQITGFLEKPKGDDKLQSDLRKVAHRTLSDLTVLAKVEDAKLFEALPPNLPPKAEKSPAFKIQTREEKLGETKVLGIRWSDADLALAWWQAFSGKGKWDGQLQRFVVADAKPAETKPAPPAPKE